MALPGPVLIGRDTDLAVVRALLTDAVAGHGGSVLIEGEPGIGKTALLEAGLADAQARGCQLLRGACDELTRRFPLSAMLAALGAEEGSADPRRAAAARALSSPGGAEGLGALLAAGDPVMAAVEQLALLVDRLCADGPVVLLVEDLHWADEASLILWHRLTRSAAQLPLLLAASCRPVPAPPGLTRLRGELERSSTGGLITLGGLSTPEVARLAEELMGRPPGERLTEHLASASGNPLYVRELLDALDRSGTLREDAASGSLDVHVDEQGPARAAVISLSRVIVDRLDSLTAETRQTLVTAALLGPVFSVGDLAVVSGRAPIDLVGAIGEALAAAVVESDGARLRFRHGLLRQALYESVPLALRVALHQQAVSALIAADAPVGRVAEMLLPILAEADGWELGWIVEHGGGLMNRAPEIAAELLEHALERLEPGDPRRARVQDVLLAVSFYLRRIERVGRIARDILSTATGTGADPERVGRAYWFLTRVDTHHTGKTEEALKTVAGALDDDRIGALWKARLAGLRSIGFMMLGRRQEARDEAERVLAEGERLADPYAGGCALHTLSLLSLLKGDLAEAIDLADRALDLMGNGSEMADLRLLVGANRFAWLADQDRFDEAEQGARQVLALAEQSWTPRMGSIRLRVAEMAYMRGRWDDAQAELEQSAEFPIGLQITAVRHAYQAMIAAHRDDWASAAEHFEVLAEPEFAADWVAGVRPVVMARVLEAERTGSPERIIDTLAPRLKPGGDLGPGWQLLLPDLARAARQFGGEQTLRVVAELCGSSVSPVPVAVQDGESPERRAGLLWSMGLLTGDPAPVLEAAAYFRSSQRLPWLGKTLEDAAVLQAERAAEEGGDVAAARATLAEALEVYAVLGAVWDSRRALARIRPFGVRPGVRGARRRPKNGWEALTGTESRVAEMVSRGLSNPDIAGRLQLSPRTVDTHVSHILTKLQVRSRREVAEHARAAASAAATRSGVPRRAAG